MEPKDLSIYQLVIEIGASIRKLLELWGKFDESIAGKWVLQSTDSIASYISEEVLPTTICCKKHC